MIEPCCCERHELVSSAHRKYKTPNSCAPCTSSSGGWQLVSQVVEVDEEVVVIRVVGDTWEHYTSSVYIGGGNYLPTSTTTTMTGIEGIVVGLVFEVVRDPTIPNNC